LTPYGRSLYDPEIMPRNPVVHFEIGCRDRAKSAEFYSNLFDWSINEQGPASNIDTKVDGAIAGHITALGHEPHRYTIFYVQVEDIKASLHKAESLGGKTLVPPITLPGAGTFAWMADPEGNTVGLLQRP
jgi:predicted enzyme related to lactoylglutathione lyase